MRALGVNAAFHGPAGRALLRNRAACPCVVCRCVVCR